MRKDDLSSCAAGGPGASGAWCLQVVAAPGSQHTSGGSHSSVGCPLSPAALCQHGGSWVQDQEQSTGVCTGQGGVPCSVSGPGQG
jgi:hypothetical protein